MKLQEAYKVMQAAWVKEHNVEVGDKVRVTGTAKRGSLGFLPEVSWEKELSGRIGKVFTVHGFKDRHIDLGGGEPYAPFFVLELVEKAKKPEKMIEVKGRQYSEDTLVEMIRQYSE